MQSSNVPELVTRAREVAGAPFSTNPGFFALTESGWRPGNSVAAGHVFNRVSDLQAFTQLGL